MEHAAYASLRALRMGDVGAAERRKGTECAQPRGVGLTLRSGNVAAVRQSTRRDGAAGAGMVPRA